ncbi:PAS domain-containing protein (plasmid) [Sulfitobacter sp. W002]|uniref:PAS domain-containing protein n=1 Tax=Sulfitobacter sp. W002 TaxID=2867024 RepID=UPI0021A4835C|nr:PAS domain-containing protein [Sulfitobacter sp. W002]UWR31866.1 PAS domain-containing protein [Sulfitobacter sp. W002]
MKKHTYGTSSKDFPTGQLKGWDDPANMGTHAIAIETMETALAAARIAVFELDLTTDTSNVSASWRDLMDVDLSDSIDFQTEWRKRIHPDDEVLIGRALTDYVTGRAPAWQWNIDYVLGMGWTGSGCVQMPKQLRGMLRGMLSTWSGRNATLQTKNAQR